jgi:hypothetical protein
MGQVHPLLESTQFQPLHASLEAQIQRNQSEISMGRQAFALPDAGLVPEDIDYDTKTRQFFVTSILQHKIVALDLHGAQRDFAPAPDHWPMFAVKVDAHRRRLWATEIASPGFDSIPAGEPGRSVLLEYDLDRGTLLTRVEGPPKSALGDMVLSLEGAPIVSDGEGGGIYQLLGRQLRRLDRGDFISPQTIALCPKDHTLFVPDYVRGLARLDPATGKATWIASDGRYALMGTDGLYCRNLTLIATQNGTAPERVVAFTLDKTRSSVVSERPIERKTLALGDPTHGVFVDNEFYYIANSGWDVLDEHGHVKPGSTLTPASIRHVEIATP